MPAWVKAVVDQWLQAANLSSGKLFRRVHKIGRAWGNGLTEKAVSHVVREYAAKAGIGKLALHDLRRTCARLCHAAGANSNRSSFSSVTFLFKPQNDTSDANSAFEVLSMTRLG